ncbi:MAG TPA: TM0106 family RecB-like putative nuclease [Candidatus Dormibacteraeota bacterium]|jgi:predicted RecB family nuclease|nr:TM0106 family RecB-like putative nuclease [Candidatus Dormibacteraeota bacterium]
MKTIGEQLRLSATDLSNHLACRHLSTLDLAVARGKRRAPQWTAPDLAVIQQLGLRHEAEYLKHLREVKKLDVVELPAEGDPKGLLEETRNLMALGADAIAQGALAGEAWYGRPDVLLKVPEPSGQWDWSYEVADTKLARETKGTTILQLALYTELVVKLQGSEPEFMWVIPPGNDFAGEAYRFAEFAAYYRFVKQKFLDSIGENARERTYPEPVEHCNVCRWFKECDVQRREDDHLSLVAGIRRNQREQLVEWKRPTVVKLAEMPIPLKERPERGSRDGYARVREQARVQVDGRTKEKLVHEAILPVAAGAGLALLPEPTNEDIFLDFEGDRFVGENGLQYLTGIAFRNAEGELQYEKRWALNSKEEKQTFEWLMDEIGQRRKANPQMHVYHFGVYEKSTLVNLASLHATREEEVDRLLRAEAIVDLHLVFKQGLRASVEAYSLKKLEAFCGYERKTKLEDSRAAMRLVEHGLELGRLEEVSEKARVDLEGYNADDCFATACLRDWLEGERKKLEGGENIPRPEWKNGDASEKLQKKLDEATELTRNLLEQAEGQAEEAADAQRLLAHLVSWHRREDKRVWQDGYRYECADDEELLDERVGLTKMRLVERLVAGRGRSVSTDRYSYEPHKTSVRVGADLYSGSVEDKFGEVVAIDTKAGIVDVKKTKKSDGAHPEMAFMWGSPLNTDAQAGALQRIGRWVLENGLDSPGKYRAGRDLLLRQAPRLAAGESLKRRASETPVSTAERIGIALEDSTLAIQGPPGSGKTYTGARMICELVKRGKKVGVTALSHKVIRNLLDEVVEASREKGMEELVKCLHRENNGEEGHGVAVARVDNDEVWNALKVGRANVVGGTTWLWAPEKAFECVDMLFIDEAGQMSLADVLAVSQAAERMVLLGDPQQLERPMKGSHPEGAEKSALEHLLDGRKTIPEDLGFFLPESWRLHPDVCKFTSRLFYEDKLDSHELARARVMEGHPWMRASGLWFVPAEHHSNRNASAEETELIAKIIDGLLKPEVEWFYSKGNKRALKKEDILIVAPYNAQVADLSERLPGMKIGTVDKFQGQEAAVVIYSMTTSSPEDAPRGMEFLFSLNRFNVATSRAKTAVIVVGNPRLFEAECRTPRQMQLANALCAYREMAIEIDPTAI